MMIASSCIGFTLKLLGIADTSVLFCQVFGDLIHSDHSIHICVLSYLALLNKQLLLTSFLIYRSPRRRPNLENLSLMIRTGVKKIRCEGPPKMNVPII